MITLPKAPAGKGDREYDKVFIVVVNWNGCADTVECVESINKTGSPGLETVIVDNGSVDASVAVLSEKFPDIKLIETGRNLGFTGGFNAGIRYALGRGAEHIILLNNDTIVDKDFVKALVDAAKVEPTGGIFCSKVYFHNPPDMLWYAGADYNIWLGWGRHRGYGELDTGAYDTLAETPRPCGCAMMVTRALCEATGLLDEGYFCYCEDIDWGMRAAKAGFKIMYAPASKVWHKASSSTGGPTTAISLYYSVRNTLRCLDKNVPLFFVLRYFRYLSVIGSSVLSLYTMKIPKRLGLRRIYQGARDYFKGRTGEFL